MQWLKRGTVWNDEFFPQPYSQLAKVYREMGHDGAARKVMIEQARLIRYHERRNARIEPDGSLSVAFRTIWPDLTHPLRWIWDFLLRWIVGYGYRPMLSLYWAVALLASAIFFAHQAWQAGAMVPNSDVILTSAEWKEVAPLQNASARWVMRSRAGPDWEAFNSVLWGLEVAVPILNLGQLDAWAPSPSRGWWGVAAWQARSIIAIMGWILAGLFTAGLTGIIKRE